jgi:hypothetical protein
MLSYEMLRVALVRTDVSEERSDTIIRMKRISEKLSLFSVLYGVISNSGYTTSKEDE